MGKERVAGPSVYNMADQQHEDDKLCAAEASRSIGMKLKQRQFPNWESVVDKIT